MQNNAAAHTGPEGSGTSHFFYTTSGGRLASFIKGDKDRYYKQQSITISGGFTIDTKKKTPISAIGYMLSDDSQLRVYYVAMDGKLKELCWSKSKGYFPGALSKKNYVVADASGLAASVDKGLIEVYCKLEKYDDSYARIWLSDPKTETWNDETLVQSDLY
ncbi:hypothetical protein Asppvi_010120 [Aspergillus pseudoviridinutans]|uniref:Fucose-specific lectin n=1 Tax=Aspergillus pseudoviridinutans TaxID=1517512 RepID=A0A9P3BKT7_9EURO|nr:uncharacterized protein Asppvi_010120 [Aspergillus pseudoviridinutans]GIJ91155.1 hypothetical protein Asppvi_010120 [Aspergillus pseudoviridinutans]